MSEHKFKNMLFTVGAFAAALLTVNCASHDINELEHANREGFEFSRELANQYQALAQREDARWDEMDAAYFATKGLQAAAGEEVLPEDPRRWDGIPSDKLDELMHHRHRLIYAIKKGGEEYAIAPKEAAAAQVAFDCIVNRMAECSDCNNTDNGLTMCQKMYEENLIKLEKAIQAQAPTFSVYFGEDQWNLTPESKEMLKQVAKVAANMSKATLNVTGFADAKGGRKHNLVLSQKRASAVAQELVRLGVEMHRILAVGVGEVEGPQVMPKHRKVMIHIH